MNYCYFAHTGITSLATFYESEREVSPQNDKLPSFTDESAGLSSIIIILY